MKDDEKTKKQLVIELTDLRSLCAALEKSITENKLAKLVALEVTRYAESIVETVREPLLVLDANLKIISANRNFYATFKVNPVNTIGRFIYDLGNKQWNIPKLRELLENILPKKEVFNGFEVEHTFQNIGHKIMLLNGRQIYRADINSKIILLAIEEITERRLIEEKVLLAAIVESSKDAIIGKSLDGIITNWNKGAEEIYGYTKSEIIGKSISVLVPPELPDEITDILSKIKLGEAIKSYETIRRRKDGQNIYVSLSVSAIYDAEGRILGASTIARDITERKQLENLLIESETQYRLLFETANDGILLIEKNEGKIAHINPSVEKMLGYSARESIGKKLQDVGLIIDNGDFQITMKNLNKRGILRYNDIPVKTRSGKQIYTDTYLVDKAKFAQCNIRDITERKKAEHALRDSEARLNLALETNNTGVWDLNLLDHTTFRTLIHDRIFGYETLLPSWTYEMFLEHVLPEDRPEVDRRFNEATATQSEWSFECRIRRTDGEVRWILAMGRHIQTSKGEPVQMLGVVQDITERKRVEKVLQESEEKYRLVVENAKESIIITQDVKVVFANNAASSTMGYSEEILTSKSFADFIHPDDINMVVDHHIRRIKGEEVPPVYSFRVISQDGTVIWCELNAVLIQWKGKLATLNFLNNINERKMAEAKLQQTLDSLKNAVGVTIHAMVSAIEMRDPYTAGHQLRVADLACTIATEMGFPKDKVDGLRMAGSIHDIGKLSIPAEILSKPTKLTDIEFSLIKEHSQRGYEMLKDVESPWPLAEIVYQHHERMNGSGYPRNLKGDDILIEARIMAVADVVEAMASHRPYRAALGIEAALAEIEKNKGILYDNAVADVCLRLFREKGYQLK